MDIIQVIVQGGAVGIAAYALFVLNKLIANHLSHLVQSIENLTAVIGELKELIRTKLDK